jgi:uncharacterized repeat protein (TIGR03803 family)
MTSRVFESICRLFQRNFSGGTVARLGTLLMPFALWLGSSQAQTFTVLHTFGVDGVCYPNEGCLPESPPILDARGNLYGTTEYGGESIDGTLYKIDSSGHYRTVANFANSGPWAAPVQDSAGNLYGTTQWDAYHGAFTAGTVWKLGKGGSIDTLFDFSTGKDGAFPFYTGLAVGSKNELYGVTGGVAPFKNNKCQPPLCGTIYKLNTKTDKLTLLHVFGNAKGGRTPGVGLVRDTSGSFYGSTGCGGTYGLGTIFELTNAGQYKVLYSFKGGKGSCATGSVGGPWGNGTLALDGEDNLYGTTWSNGKFGYGMVFKLSKSGKLRDLHDFTGGNDGAYPWGSVVLDAKGNIFGTSQYVSNGGPNYGTIFEIDSTGHFNVLYAFSGTSDGAAPMGLIIDKTGSNLYGTTSDDGDPTCLCGTAFKVALQ